MKSGKPRSVNVTCKSQYEFAGDHYDRLRPGPDKTFSRECPAGTRCEAVFHINKDMSKGPTEEIACVDEENIVTETVNSKASTSGTHQVHCGLSLALPGSHYRAAPAQKTIDVVLTEQVTYPNGTPYPAPLLYIRETTPPYASDRALRTDGSVVSALIELSSYRGNFIQKQFEFCMQMLPGHVATSVMFTYSFFQVTLRHRHISGEQPLQFARSAEALHEEDS